MAQDTSSSPAETLGALDDYVLLGRSGLRVSPLCLGTLTFGEHWGFGSDHEESKKVFDMFYERGGNFFDTANFYQNGESERFLGDYVSDKRSHVVVATKYTGSLHAVQGGKYSPNSGGNHRKSLVESLDTSLKRMNLSYVDLLYVHFYDFRTPIEEMMRSLDDVIRSGKSLYVAISDAPSWTIARANTMAELRGWSPFIGLQTRYNLLERSFEFDLQPACAELDIGVLPWGSIAEGFLTGKYTKGSSLDSLQGYREKIKNIVKHEKNWKILDEVIAISKEINRTPAQVSLNWLQQRPGVTSSLIGARTATQLEENLKALEFKLTPEQMARLDAVSAPNEVPFPHSLLNTELAYLIGKTVETPKKFQPVLNIRPPI